MVTTSIFDRGIKKQQMNSLDTEVNLDYPKALWGVTAFKPKTTTLKALYDKKIEVESIENKILSEKSRLNENSNRIVNYKRAEIQSILMDLNQEKYIKKQEFEQKLDQIETDRVERINKAKKSFEDRKNELILQKEAEYKLNLSKWYKLIYKTNKILEYYKAKPNEKALQGITDSVAANFSYEDMKELITSAENAIINVLEDNLIADKPFTKVKEMEGGSAKAVAGAAALALAWTPIIPVVGSAIFIGTTIKSNQISRKRVEEILGKVIQMRQICLINYNRAKSQNTLNILSYETELTDTLAGIEDIYTRQMEDIRTERTNWEEDYLERCEINYEERYNRETQEELTRLSNRYNESLRTLNQQKEKLISEYNELEEDLKIKNRIEPIVDTKIEDGFQRIKECKKMTEEWCMYNNLKKLDLDTDMPVNPTEEQKAQIDYNTSLFRNEYTPLKEKLEGLARKGQGEDYWKRELAAANRSEDKFHVLKTNGLHLGKLIQEDKYNILSQNQEVFSEDWDNKSILFFYRDEEEESILIEYVKYLTLQILGNTHPTAVNVNIINPTVDTKFNDILINPTKLEKTGEITKLGEYVTNRSGENQGAIETSINHRIQRLIGGDLAGGKTIEEVILDKRATFSKTPTYTINILHRAGNHNSLIRFNENSATTGIINFCLIDARVFKVKEKDGFFKIEMDEATKASLIGTKIMVYLNSKSDKTVLNIVNANGNYQQIKLRMRSIENTSEVVKGLEQRYKNAVQNKTFILIDEYINDIIPPEEIWADNCDEVLKLNFGYVDGDRSKPTPIIMDLKSKVHAMLCGTTGGGKSVTLAAMINVLKMRYAPSELQIYYYDFKKVEVALHTYPYKWPNASALSASVTGDYLISLLKYIQKEMEYRYDISKEYSVNNFKSLKNAMKKEKAELIARGEIEKAKMIEIPAMILVIVDEFQGAFEIDDDTTEQVKTILEDLGRRARAAGIHMLMVSQDPGSKIPGAVQALFPIRACTVASKEISRTVLGNDFAARPENQFIGFLGTNTMGGEESDNRQYVVPFSKEPMSMLYSKLANDIIPMHEGEVSRNALVFDDDSLISYDMLDNYIKNYKTAPGDIVVGQKVLFQFEDIPAKIELDKDMGQNISFISVDKEKRIEFYKTVMKSIEAEEDSRCITIFPKEYEEEWGTEEFNTNPALSWTSYTNRDTGKVSYQPSNDDINQISIDNGTWVTKTVFPKYVDLRFFTPRPGYGEDRADFTMNGWILYLNNMLSQAIKTKKKKGEAYGRYYMVIVEPERDSYIVPERLWSDPGFKLLMNEASANGLHIICISSEYSRVVANDIFRYQVGILTGPDAAYEKPFRRLEPNLARISYLADPSKNIKVKLPSTEKKSLLPWRN